MIKTFNEMMALNLTGHISKKPSFKRDKRTGELVKVGELEYLNWADCLALLHENGAEKVLFGNERTDAGELLFMNNGVLPFLRVFVEIDGDRRTLDYPLIDGSKDITMEKAVQSDLHNATQRAFVKCVAINWGLGLSLWQKEDADDQKAKDDQTIVENSNIYAIKTRIERRVTELLKRGMDMSDILASVGMRDAQFKKVMNSYFDMIALLEERLTQL